MKPSDYCENLFAYKRINTRKAHVGNLTIGGLEPVRVQSMTTTNTNDTKASVEQAIRIINAGGEVVRLTTQGRPEAQNMENISKSLRAQGYTTPLVADVHYNPAAAEIAAKYSEKVRINPGNYTGGAKRFDEAADNMSQEEWMSLIKEKLTPLVTICKEHNTALRIGVNHGSLSDRIMAKYGDTPEGMVESCMEYLEALENLDFFNIVISIKASNTRIMVYTVRQLMARMRARGSVYPLHLGVTEAGSDAEGRIKSAAGIGALLTDGIGDTIRVSLTEAPEAEIPVAKQLVDHISAMNQPSNIDPVDSSSYSPYSYSRRETTSVLNIGGINAPVVVSTSKGFGEYYLNGNSLVAADGKMYDFIDIKDLNKVGINENPEKPLFVFCQLPDLNDKSLELLKKNSNMVIVTSAQNVNNQAREIRAFILKLNVACINAPVIVKYSSDEKNLATFQLKAATDLGLLFIDGLADGILLSDSNISNDNLSETAYSILQATQSRFSKAEFISCPGCGRTLYDLQSTVQRIKAKLGHLKGLKIGVMGCIVNGIGEMADAHYGYVGAGYDKISLYRGKILVKKELNQEEALDQLIDIIKQDNLWIEP
ncbi:MAG: (E)-4-hydroxy-3-methylbut-2-enyl-diphosphate synthase [Bacteroidales bacterium]|nr:(E)-4-hydroxy-3-methylbut-2-enyl-diphosphate synthase [Bacteroidales bacterium]